MHFAGKRKPDKPWELTRRIKIEFLMRETKVLVFPLAVEQPRVAPHRQGDEAGGGLAGVPKEDRDVVAAVLGQGVGHRLLTAAGGPAHSFEGVGGCA